MVLDRIGGPSRELVGRLSRRLLLALGRDEARPTPAGEDFPPVLPPQVEFVAYAEDCVLSGFVRLGAARLTDLLNDHEDYVLLDVFASDLATGGAREVSEIEVHREELLLVHASGPRGDTGRRVRTRQFPVALRSGPFEVRGYLHCPPGANPIASFRRRKTMVPLTDAWIDYVAGGIRQRRRVATLIVNREQVDWIVEAIDDEVEVPDIPLKATTGGLAKDFTESLRVHEA